MIVTLRWLRPITERTLEQGPELGSPSRFVGHPRSELERRAVTDMLTVAARKLGDPISLVVLVVAGDRPFHLHHPTSASQTSAVFVTLLFRLLDPGPT